MSGHICENCETPHDSKEGAIECCACPHCVDLEAAILSYKEKATIIEDALEKLRLIFQNGCVILTLQGHQDFIDRIARLEAQLKVIKSKLLYFPDENHWVLNAQNGIIWQTEFFKWLSETIE